MSSSLDVSLDSLIEKNAKTYSNKFGRKPKEFNGKGVCCSCFYNCLFYYYCHCY